MANAVKTTVTVAGFWRKNTTDWHIRSIPPGENPGTLTPVIGTIAAGAQGMVQRKKTGPEPEYDNSMAIAGWLVISLILWGVLLLLLI